MKTKIYTLRDSVIANHSLPFYAQNNDHAKRICKELLVAGDTTPSQNPSDFELFCIGEYCDDTGTISPELNIQSICRLDALLAVSPHSLV